MTAHILLGGDSVAVKNRVSRLLQITGDAIKAASRKTFHFFIYRLISNATFCRDLLQSVAQTSLKLSQFLLRELAVGDECVELIVYSVSQRLLSRIIVEGSLSLFLEIVTPLRQLVLRHELLNEHVL